MNDDSKSRDEFALLLLEESKRFLEKARLADSEGQSAFLHAALLLAFSALEAHINSIAEDFASEVAGLSAHEIGVLHEREVRLEEGEFIVSNTLKMVRLEDRIRFICKRFANKRIVDFSGQWWAKFIEASRLRNDLTHPKGVLNIDSEAIASALEGIIGTIDAIYLGIYGRKFPYSGMQLDSTLSF